MSRITRPIRMLLAAALCSLLAIGPAAAAVDYTDIWWNADESGWGVNFVQSDDFIFATFFIYGAGKKPKWVSAQLRKNAFDWAGPVYATTGTDFSKPWDPANNGVQKVGDARFEPTGGSTGRLSYAIEGITVDKHIARQTLTAIPLEGFYNAQVVYKTSSCSNPDGNQGVAVALDLTVTRAGDVLTFDFNQGNVAIEGAALQDGSRLRMPAATLTFGRDASRSGPAQGNQLKLTDLGIEGAFTALLLDGCVVSLVFTGYAQ